MLQLLSIRCQHKDHTLNIKDMLDGFQHLYRIRRATTIQLINQNKCGCLFLFLANNCPNPQLYFVFEQLYCFCLFTRVLKERFNQLPRIISRNDLLDFIDIDARDFFKQSLGYYRRSCF